MRATRIVGHPSLTLPSASSHPTPSPPHALRNTLFVVVVYTLKAVPISIQYLLTSSVLVQLTRMNAFHSHRLTTQKGYTYAAYKTRNEYFFDKNSWIVRDGSRFSDCAPDEIFQGNFLTPPSQIVLGKNHRKKRLDGHKIFRKMNISALSSRHCGPHPSSIK